jgi:predicted glutamine amidotransferase
MCGLVYGHSLDKRPVNNYILEQYKKQRSRGTEGFGVFDGQFNHLIHHPSEKGIKRWLKRYQSNILMFHHRNPTSTINVRRACHPFSTGDYFGDNEYILIHNGYIWNADDRFVDHQEMGIQYKSLLQDLTFNDSESLLWDFALYMEGKIDKIESGGAIAFICVKLVDGELTNLYFGRNSNPLHMDNTSKGLFLASEGKGKMIDAYTLYDYTYADNMYSLTDLELGSRPIKQYSGYQSTRPYAAQSWDYADADSDGYFENGIWIPRNNVCSVPAVRSALTDGGPGGWLSDELKERYETEEVVEYVDDGSGIMVPMTTTRVVPRKQQPLDFPSLTAAGENLIMQYLIRHRGNFEKAYEALEEAYEASFDDDFPDTVQRERMEKAMALLSRNTEWISPNSVSSVWRALWTQTTNVA